MKFDKVASAVHEIVHVPLDATRLYCELIQVIELRDRLWVRPLCLCEYDEQAFSQGHLDIQELMDLRGSSDLVWPAHLFVEVLDMEWVDILMRLEPEAPALGMLAKQNPEQAQKARHALRQFWELAADPSSLPSN